jgi:hypothetical protein
MFTAMLTLSRGGNYYDAVKYVQRLYAVLLLYSVFILQPEDSNKLWYVPADPRGQLIHLLVLSVLVYVSASRCTKSLQIIVSCHRHRAVYTVLF